MNWQSTQPLVSVIMTAYNRQNFISEAIVSVLASEYQNFELIIVDDCSHDDTYSIALKYEATDSRIRLYCNEENLGDYPNRNKAVGFAKGKYIMFCDSDDLFFPDSISYCVTAMEKFPGVKAGLYYAGLGEPFIIDKEKLSRKHFFEQSVLHIGPGGTILDRAFFSSIGGYPQKYGPANDMYFNLKLLCTTDILLLPRLFLHYRIHEGQEKNNAYAYIHNNYRYLNDALNELNLGLSPGEMDYLNIKNNRRFAVNLLLFLKRTRSPAATRQLWRQAGFSFKNFLSGLFHFRVRN